MDFKQVIATEIHSEAGNVDLVHPSLWQSIADLQVLKTHISGIYYQVVRSPVVPGVPVVVMCKDRILGIRAVH